MRALLSCLAALNPFTPENDCILKKAGFRQSYFPEFTSQSQIFTQNFYIYIYSALLEIVWIGSAGPAAAQCTHQMKFNLGRKMRVAPWNPNRTSGRWKVCARVR